MNIDTLRKYRIMDIAIFDVVSGLLALYALLKIMGVRHSLLIASILLFPIAIFTHWLTNTDTMLNYYIGLSAKPLRNT